MARIPVNKPKKRRNPLKDNPSENLKVEVDLRDKIVQDLYKKLKKDNYGQQVVEQWNTANADRGEWLQRQETLLADYDEFLESSAEGPFEQASSLHLPMPFIVIKTLHARFLQAVFGGDESFHVAARNEASSERAPVVQELLKYMIEKHANNRSGVFKTVDLWLWSWAATGVGFVKAHWDRKFIRYKDVKEELVQGQPILEVDERGNEILKPTAEKREVEKDVTQLIWEGASLDYMFPEDVVIIGEDGNDDPQTADTVIHKKRMTESSLRSWADQGIFDKKAVEEVLASGNDGETAISAESNESGNIKERRADNAGQKNMDSTVTLKRYAVLECYSKICVDDSGLNSDVVMWVHAKSKKLLRATYLQRINKNGKRPIFKIDFLRRPGQPYSMGLAEILHPLSVEMDAMHNMRIDFGLLSTMPFGFYRPTSSIDPKIIKLEPGALIPLDNPQTDINIPQFGNRVSFGHQEEASLNTWSERLTGISDLTLGAMSGTQGASRTATGVRGLIGEMSANLDVFLRRLNEGWSQVLGFILDLLQQRLPKDFVFRVTSDADLAARWVKLATRDEILGDYDIEISPNSSTSNQQIKEQQSNDILQLTSNPMDIQLGIVTPYERYEAIKNALKVRGVKDVTKFIRRPEGMDRQYTPEEEANRILRGVEVPVSPMSDHAGYLKYVAEIQKDDMLSGQFSPEEIEALVVQGQKHQQMMQALQQQAAQQRNQQQLRTNKALGQEGQASSPGGEGGLTSG